MLRSNTVQPTKDMLVHLRFSGFRTIALSLTQPAALVLAASLTIALGVLPPHARASGRDYPATWSLEASRLTAHQGDTVLIPVTVRIEKGWHTYGIKEYLTADGIGPQRTEFSTTLNVLHLLGHRIRISPAPHVEYDSAFEISVEKLKGTVRFTLPFLVTAKSAGTFRDTLRIYHQLCTSQNCLPPEEILLPFTLDVRASTGMLPQTDAAVTPTINSPAISNTAAGTIRQPTPSATPATTGDEQQSSSWAGLLLLAVALGVGSWLMPCVYPMIPITVSFFTKRAEKEHTRPVLDSVVYSFGIMSTFIVFGAIAAFFFGATAGRDIATNPWLNLALALLFLVIAGNLFGMYELRLPSRWVNALNRESSRVHGYRSSFLMGMVFSLTSFTCTVPFVDLIGKMAAGGEWFRPLIAMTLYAGVFALPFFALALFPTYIQRLPRSGIWMNHLKVAFAFIEIAFAISYFARVDSILGLQMLSRELVLALWASCALLIGLYVLGVFRTKLDTPLEYVGGIRASIATVFIALALYMVQGMFGGSVGPFESFVYVESERPVTQLSNHAPSPTTATVLGKWTENLDAALRQAKESNTPVFVDFTGVSCTNCRWMEKNMFTKPSVRALMDRMILVRAFTDRRNNPQDAFYKRYQQERFGSTLLPFYVIMDPSGAVIATSTYTASEEEFVSFLRKATTLTTSAAIP
ncbi:MAG: thiol:disulfide interchange protein DsbD [Candidatus Kapaibacterium sp.]|nr:MAG: thiol:disulfide interchange protein DsbD [Candidatus Kapabacteria bacterium]